MPLVYRAPMRSRGDDVDPGLAVERALLIGVCGVGGSLSRGPRGIEEALALTEQEYDARTARRLERFAEVAAGSFVWTRDLDGMLHLGRLTGEWRYDAEPEAVAADLVHVRDCRFLAFPMPEADAPPAVVHTYRRGGRNFQQIHDAAVGGQSLTLWESLSPGVDDVTAGRGRGH
jgi:hypothetical protein